MTSGSTGYPQWALSEAYDRYGNRTAQAAVQGYGCTGCPINSVSVSATTNQITGAPYAYDLGGNMTNDGSNTLVYDAENHAVSATSGGGSGTYTYDGNGLRVKKVSGSTTTVYIFSGSQVIAEYDNGALVGSPSREYIYSGAALLAKIDREYRFYLGAWPVQLARKFAVHQIADFPIGNAASACGNHTQGSEPVANVPVIGFGVELGVGQHQTEGTVRLAVSSRPGKVGASLLGPCRACCARMICRSTSATTTHFRK